MNILRLRAYYKPELTSAEHMSEDMEKVYIENNITNIYYTPMPSRGVPNNIRNEYKHKKYEELESGLIQIHRFSMFREGKNPIQRAFRYILCNIAEYIKGIHAEGIDLVHSSSTPPTQGLLSGLVAKKLSKKYGYRVPFVYNLQDIFPDSLVNARMTKKGSILWKIGRKIEDYTYQLADRIIVINNSFKKNLIDKGVPDRKIITVQNWVDLDVVKPIPRNKNNLFSELGIRDDKFTIVYAGNLGETQGVEIILDVARSMSEYNDIQFVVFGGGSCYTSFVSKSKELLNVQVFPLLAQERVAEVYSLGDVVLITCKSGTGSSGMPSKIWSIMACNVPIIASFDIDSEMAMVLKAAEAGVCVPPEDAKALRDEIALAYSKRYEKKPCNSRCYVVNTASKEICTKRYLDVLIETVDENRNIQ